MNGEQSGGARRKAKGAKMPTLEKELDELIARREKVRPEQVTLEFIRDKRESEVYAKERLDLTTNYGGKVATGRFYGWTEAKAAVEKAYLFLARFSNG